jgi:hypothetical protein
MGDDPLGADYGYVDISTRPLDWEYYGPDEDGEVTTYLQQVEGGDYYRYGEEVPDIGGEPMRDQLYLINVGRRLEFFEEIFAVLYPDDWTEWQ